LQAFEFRRIDASLMVAGMSKPEGLHVVLGAGQIGTRLANLLADRGERVRLVARRQPKLERAGVERLAGDITDLAFAESAGRGAAVVYDCMNPPYPEWQRLLLRIGRGSLHAAKTASAKLVALDCLYMYGRPDGPMSETSALAPCSRKGKLRVELAELRLGAMRRGEVDVSIARASDFFGADLPFSAFSDRFFQRIYAGKAAECMGDPDALHSYTYADDVAIALATLGTREGSSGVWHVPTNAAESTRALSTRIGDALGLSVEVERVPKIALRAVGLFVPFMREIVEMTYQWEQAFVIDDSRFRAAFGVEPTPIDDAVDAIGRFARGRFGQRARA
jgi:nucleoside-diphosphate-sugar epimerase